MCSPSLFSVWKPRRSQEHLQGLFGGMDLHSSVITTCHRCVTYNSCSLYHIKHKKTTWYFNIKCYKKKSGWRVRGGPWNVDSRCIHHKVLLFYPTWSAKWCLTKLFHLLWYLKVKVCTKWCLCGSVVPGAPGHEHIRKPLHQRPMAFQTVIRTETRGWERDHRSAKRKTRTT